MKKHNKANPKLPKGAHRLPTGSYVSVGKWSEADRRGRRVRITAVHKDPPDMDKLTRAFLHLAQQLTEADAQRAIDWQSRKGRRV